MTRLSQIIALEKGTKTRSEQAAKFAYHELQKTVPLSGITKTYQPKDEDGDLLPAERQPVQLTVEGAEDSALRQVAIETARYLDLVGAKENTNRRAAADVLVDGQVFIAQAPVTYLLALERQLQEELVQIRRLPTLPLDIIWAPAAEPGVWQAAPSVAARTKKVRRNHVRAEATDKHPAQVETYDEDTTVGWWTTTKFSGAIPANRKALLIRRVTTLIEAVKMAREEANTTEVEDFKYGNQILGFIYG